MNKIPDFWGVYMYSNYDQLRRMRRDFPKRCATATPSGIPCEYYTMPRNVDALPAGYTPYTQHQVYDVNNKGELVRVSIRVPRYKDENGNVCEEVLSMVEGKYTHDAMDMLHQYFRDPAYTYDDLLKRFPLGKNATTDAYDTLLPWAKRNHAFPAYPDRYTHLWFVSVPYKQSILTFCTYAYLGDKPKYLEFSLFDICIDDNFDSLKQNMQRHAYGSNKKACICIPANYALYKTLHSVLPDATYTFDEFQLLTVMKDYADKHPEAKTNFLSLRSETLIALKQMYCRSCSVKEAQSICAFTIKFLLDYRNSDDLGFINDLEFILREQPNFIDSFFEINEFHMLLPFQIQKAIQEFRKKRGYEPERLSYMLLSSVRNLEYVEPDRCYSFNPAFMTDEELEEMKEIDEEIIHNALMSSVLETLDKMSDGILYRSFYGSLIY